MFDEAAAEALLASYPPLCAYSGEARAALLVKARRVRAAVAFHGARGLCLDEAIRSRLATLIAWPLLGLPDPRLRCLRDVVVQPDTFRAHRREFDESTGIVVEGEDELAGEAGLVGPMVISLADLEEDLAHPEDGQNVVLHELAHKLDAESGDIDGCPLLCPPLSVRQWSAVMQAAYDSLCAEVDAGLEPAIDPYAAQSPEEFFAVCSEWLFLCPTELSAAYPEVAALLRRYYGQGSG